MSGFCISGYKSRTGNVFPAQASAFLWWIWLVDFMWWFFISEEDALVVCCTYHSIHTNRLLSPRVCARGEIESAQTSRVIKIFGIIRHLAKGCFRPRLFFISLFIMVNREHMACWHIRLRYVPITTERLNFVGGRRWFSSVYRRGWSYSSTESVSHSWGWGRQRCCAPGTWDENMGSK